MDAEVVLLEGSCRLGAVGGGAADHHGAADKEHELPTRPQQARRFGTHQQGSSQVLAPYSEIAKSALILEGHIVRACTNNLERLLELPLEHAGAVELLVADVDADRARAALGEPGTDMRRAAAKLDRVGPFLDTSKEPEAVSGVAQIPHTGSSASQYSRPSW